MYSLCLFEELLQIIKIQIFPPHLPRACMADPPLALLPLHVSAIQPMEEAAFSHCSFLPANFFLVYCQPSPFPFLNFSTQNKDNETMTQH